MIVYDEGKRPRKNEHSTVNFLPEIPMCSWLRLEHYLRAMVLYSQLNFCKKTYGKGR
jgi:hypothetical protein